MYSNKKYKALLFDLDGTLLDTQEGILHSVRHTLDILGSPELSESTLLQFVGPPIQESLQHHLHLTEEEAQQGANIFRNFYKSQALFEAHPYNGILEVLELIHKSGIKVAVATYKREDYAIDILNHFSISQFCDVIHGADNENQLTKADIIELCIRDLQIEKENVILIGDTDHDAKGAQYAGIDFAAVTWGFGYKRGNIRSLFSIAQIFNETRELIHLIQ